MRIIQMKNQLIQTNKKMKKLMMLTIFIFTVATVFGQGKNVTKANTLLTKGELAEAAALIEPAIAFEKTMEKGKTWYTRAQIYDKIAASEDESLKSSYPEALKIAAESYQKTKELEKEGSTYHGLATVGYDQLYGTALNKGVEGYNNGDYAAAYLSFMDVAAIAPTDTTGYLYGAMMAQEIENYDNALMNYNKLFELGVYKESAMNSVIYIYLNQKEDPAKALEYVKIAQEKFPEVANYQRQEVDILIKMDKMDDAIIELKDAIEREPENALLVSNLAMLYDMGENYDEAEKNYKKALELEPDNRNALVNLSVLYIGKGDEIMKVVNAMSIKEYNKNIDKAEKDAAIEYAKAIPLLTVVIGNDEKDELGLQNLQAVYAKLKDGDKAEEIYNKRKEYGYVTED
jgi:tetratricopeptide (TPR) repeat protein